MPPPVAVGRIGLLALFSGVVAPALLAQGPTVEPGSPPASVAVAHAIPVPTAHAAAKTGAIVIDGKLDEAAWQDATPITEFRQTDPDIGQPSSEPMQVRFLYDDEALYIGASMHDALGPAGITSTVVRRDNAFNSDYFEVVIDGYHDHLSRAFFDVNPSGSINDQLGIGLSCCDAGWDPVWEVKTQFNAVGWVAVIRIPFSQLRFSRDSVQTWGLQVRRFIQRRNETDQWSYWGKEENGGPARFGHLEGIHIPRAPRHLELLPYVATKSEHLISTPGDPFHSGGKQSAHAGLDLKSLLTPNLTLDATVNPDFGQVEVDPAVVNLSAFETFFPEHRPFFVSGSGVFDFGGFNCFFCSNVSNLQAFYSRRVGRAPSGADLATSAGPYADVPDATTILGAAKITGRTQNGYTVGLLNATTGQANAEVQRGDGTRTSQEVEPLTNFFVGRLKKDYLDGNLVIGTIVTSSIRKLDSTFTPRLSQHAELLGADYLYTWRNKNYSLMGNAAMSGVEGDARVILADQLSSARYFQRPDRGRGWGGFFSTRLDSNATAMRGLGGYTRLAKDAGTWTWETAINWRTASFETNDYSFLTNADYIWYNANIAHAWITPTSWYRTLNVLIGGQEQRNFDGNRTQGTQAQAYVSGQTPQFWQWSNFYIWYPSGTLDDRLLRGGPEVRVPGSGYYSAALSTDARKQWQININPSFSWNDARGWGNSYSLSTTFQPSSRVYLSLGPSFSVGRSKFQYVQAVTDPTAIAFGGMRYVVSDLSQNQLGFETRVNVTFNPRMTLELYAQPFIAAEAFDAFKQFNAPRAAGVSVYGRDVGTIAPVTDSMGRVASYRIDPDGAGPSAPFSIDNPDFNLRSLRGNAVFRWEYRPGSTVYFAWTQSRSGMASIGDFDFVRDRQALFDSRPENIFLMKASWWLSR